MLYLTIGARCALLAVFAVSWGGKVAGRRRLAAFQNSLGELRLVPAGWRAPVALAVVAAEGATAVLLAVPGRAAGTLGLAGAALLLAAFTLALAVALRRGARAACGCFGPSRVLVGARHLIRNAALISVALTGLVAGGMADGGAVPVSGAVLAAFTGLLAGGLVTELDDILDLFRPVHTP